KKTTTKKKKKKERETRERSERETPGKRKVTRAGKRESERKRRRRERERESEGERVSEATVGVGIVGGVPPPETTLKQANQQERPRHPPHFDFFASSLAPSTGFVSSPCCCFSCCFSCSTAAPRGTLGGATGTSGNSLRMTSSTSFSLAAAAPIRAAPGPTTTANAANFASSNHPSSAHTHTAAHAVSAAVSTSKKYAGSADCGRRDSGVVAKSHSGASDGPESVAAPASTTVLTSSATANRSGRASPDCANLYHPVATADDSDRWWAGRGRRSQRLAAKNRGSRPGRYWNGNERV
ncbi:hypothetical protein DFJ73DRAFT_847800, partial [Zopfochytrium polystomum]